MTELHRIAIVDDDRITRFSLIGLLKSGYTIVEFSSGKEFLDALPDVEAVLLDIEMPQLNGYETCQHLRMVENKQDLPVIFVSGHDSDQDRLAAYEAGGDDFVTKPILADELRLKVAKAVARNQQIKQVRELQSSSSMAQQMAFSVMTNMGELGVIMEFMRGSASLHDPKSLAEKLLRAIHSWDLRGSVQLRGGFGEYNYSGDLESSPLQNSVMNNLRSMGRIFEMGSRTVINFPHVSVLISNSPKNDPEKVGRMRDNLAVLCETADSLVTGLDAMYERSSSQETIRLTLSELQELLRVTSSKSQKNREATEHQLDSMVKSVMSLLNSYGLTPVQKSLITEQMHIATEDMLYLLDEATQIGNQFENVLSTLSSLAHKK